MSIWKLFLFQALWVIGIALTVGSGKAELLFPGFVGFFLISLAAAWTYLRLYKVK